MQPPRDLSVQSSRWLLSQDYSASDSMLFRLDFSTYGFLKAFVWQHDKGWREVKTISVIAQSASSCLTELSENDALFMYVDNKIPPFNS
jgi:hypothetical protein